MNIYLAFIGCLMFFFIMFFLMKGKVHPIVVLVLCPVVAAFLAGYGYKEVVSVCLKGLNTVWKNGVLFIFSVMFFSVMSDAGMFDGLVNWLIKKAGKNVIMVTVVTTIVATIAHMDGSTAMTALITIPAMLPIYDRLHMDRKTLLLLIGVSMTMMNLTPWGGPTLRIATVLNMDVNELWKHIIPMQVIGLLITFGVGVYFGYVEKRKGAGKVLPNEKFGDSINNASQEELALKRPHLILFDWIFTILVVCTLIFNIMPAYLSFLVAFCVAIAVNYPDLKLEQKIFAKHANSALMVSATMISAGPLVGVITHTEILNALVQLIVSCIPNVLGPYLHLIFGVLSMPMGVVLNGDAYFYGFFPLAAKIGEQFGISPMNMGISLLSGKNAVMIVAPVTPVTFLATGLADVPLKDHIKYSFKYLWVISVIFMAGGILVGAIQI